MKANGAVEVQYHSIKTRNKMVMSGQLQGLAYLPQGKETALSTERKT